MDSRSPLDRIRLWVEGNLTPEEAALVEREVEADPELQAFAAQYGEIHGMSAALDEPPAPRTSFEDLELRMDKEARRRVLPFGPLGRLVAAAVVLAVGLAFFWGSRHATAPAVELAAISLEELTVPPPLVLPATLASYRPVEDGAVQWFASLDEARAAARVAERPLLVFGTLPGCPIAARVRAGQMANGHVLDVMEHFVPVEVDLSELEPGEMAAVLQAGYPLLEVQEVDGKIVHEFSGEPPAPALREHLERGLAIAAETGTPAWGVIADLAQLTDRALAAERNGRFFEACDAYARLEGSAAGGAAFHDAGRDGLLRIGQIARDVLLEAQAQSDAAGVERVLEDAVQSFDGTPFGVDFAEVLACVRENGSFPELVGPAVDA